jgi:hypothetical protein
MPHPGQARCQARKSRNDTPIVELHHPRNAQRDPGRRQGSAETDPALLMLEALTLHLSVELPQEAGRLASHPAREVGRLEHEAEAGESAATPAILIVGMAIVAWALVALVVASVLVATALLKG